MTQILRYRSGTGSTSNRTDTGTAFCTKGAENRQRTFSLWLSPNNTRLVVSASTSANWNTIATSATELGVGEWTHLSYVVEDNQLTLYINGKADASVQLAGTVLANNGNLYVGKSPWNDTPRGTIAKLTLFNRALSAKEHSDLYWHTLDRRD